MNIEDFFVCSNCNKKTSCCHYWCDECLDKWGWGAYAKWLEYKMHKWHSAYNEKLHLEPPRKPGCKP